MKIHILEGRMNRKNFILSQIALMALAFIIGLYILRDGFSVYVLGSILPVLVLLLPLQFICAYRRLQDLNIHGLWAFLMFIPYIALLFFIYISYKKGDTFVNKYGEPDTRRFIDSIINKDISRV